MSTRYVRQVYRVIGSRLDPAEPASRLEVCLYVPNKFNEPPLVYLTKYRGHVVGDQSVGLHLDVVDEVAAMLQAAAASARNEFEASTARQENHEQSTTCQSENL